VIGACYYSYHSRNSARRGLEAEEETEEWQRIPEMERHIGGQPCFIMSRTRARVAMLKELEHVRKEGQAREPGELFVFVSGTTFES